MKTINELLRGLRVDRDLKQSDIAEMIGTTQQQYSRYETGESDLPLHAFRILADYYGVSADYLMGRVKWANNVPGLERTVIKDYTAEDALNDILSLGADGRAAVVEYITLQKMKQSCERKKEKDGSRL